MGATAAYQLSHEAKQAMTQLHEKTIEAWGRGGKPGEYFSATPSIEQTLREKILQDGNAFLSKINDVPVTQIKGQKVMPSLSGPVTSRTAITTNTERKTKQLLATDFDEYELFSTETDVAIGYATIDSWAGLPGMVDAYGRLIRQTIANERLIIGWNGISAAATTDPVANPLLQDVNIGWTKKIKDFNSGSQHTAGTVGVPIAIGSAAFPNLDVVVHSAKAKLKEQYRNRPDLVVLVSSNLMTAAQGKYYAVQGNTPTEKKEIELGIVVDTYGGLPSMVPPFFPDGLVWVTPLNNLSIYWQRGSWRRMQRDYAPKNAYEDFNSRNEGYVVEDYEACYLLSNVTIAS